LARFFVIQITKTTNNLYLRTLLYAEVEVLKTLSYEAIVEE